MAGTAANDRSLSPDVSLDGRFVVFVSAASNLVPSDVEGRWDIFVRDRRPSNPDFRPRDH
jgi:Tol biopolymer transport system component